MDEQGEHADLLTTTWSGREDEPAVVLLHGSGQDETSLLSFARAACPGRTLIAVRGRIPWEDGFAFFRRRPDRTLDDDDLALGAATLHRLLTGLRATSRQPLVLCGYSNGAVVAAATLLLDPRLTAGAVLLRPLSPWPGRRFPRLDGCPLLLVGAAHDERRHPHDGPTLLEQVRQAGARAEWRELAVGHALTPADEALVRRWIETVPRTRGRRPRTTAAPQDAEPER